MTGRGVIRPPFVFVSSRIGPNSQEYRQLDTGPVAGFWVDDAAAARHELIEDGVDSCTLLERGPDRHGWFYFRAPDGNYYEMCERAHPEGHRNCTSAGSHEFGEAVECWVVFGDTLRQCYEMRGRILSAEVVVLEARTSHKPSPSGCSMR
jgi:hypothetical protein